MEIYSNDQTDRQTLAESIDRMKVLAGINEISRPPIGMRQLDIAGYENIHDGILKFLKSNGITCDSAVVKENKMLIGRSSIECDGGISIRFDNISGGISKSFGICNLYGFITENGSKLVCDILYEDEIGDVMRTEHEAKCKTASECVKELYGILKGIIL